LRKRPSLDYHWDLPLKENLVYKTRSGAVKLQVLVTPAEYRELHRRAKQLHSSVSMLARSYLADALLNAGPAVNLLVPGGKYQPRGFARKRS